MAAGLLLLAACAARPPEAGAGAGSRAPGEISVPFRNRWWHFYERALSWADAGLDAQAEPDLRQCLALRQTDSRQARTYGMHFVQCFAHRELGALLLRGGRLDEAERELRLSQTQEPSAKAAFLLERLERQRRGEAVPEPEPAGAAPVSAAIRLDRVEPVGAGLRIAGQLLAGAGAMLWSIDGGGRSVRLPTDAAGAFSAEVPSGTSLCLGTATGPDRDQAPLAAAPPAEALSLRLDGPERAAVVADGRAWYRWQAEAAGGLAQLEVRDGQGTALADLPLHGLRAAGTLRLDLAAGAQTLRFRLRDAGGAEAVAEREVEARPGLQQDRRLRAVALALPLQAPRPGAMRPGDDPRLRSALLEDGRFRFVDAQADEVLARELALVEAGYVDRATAAAAGKRLACRYVIAGTMTRGERDAECFLRLVHCDSGQVVATADAYAEIAASADADRLFAATAGRLRQVFPVVAGEIVRTGDDQARFGRGRRDGTVARMRVHVFAAPLQPGAEPLASVEVGSLDDLMAETRRSGGSLPERGWGVSE